MAFPLRDRCFAATLLMLAFFAAAPTAFSSPPDAAAERSVAAAISGRHAAGLGIYSSAGRPQTPLALLPRDLTYPAGKVTIVIDPGDSNADGICAAYLVNDSPAPLVRVDTELAPFYREVWLGDHWEPTDDPFSDCGTATEPRDLPAAHALLMNAAYPETGDTPGEIRYVFGSHSHPLATTSPRPGRYDSQALTRTRMLAGATLPGMFHADQWWINGISRTPVEALSALELLRGFDHSLPQTRTLQFWSADPNRKSPGHDFEAEVRKILAKPWDRYRDIPGTFSRCFAILTGPPVETVTQASRPVVWRFLSEMPGQTGRLFVSADWQPGAPGSQAGNPWAASDDQLRKLAETAIAAVLHSPLDESDAAAGFLTSSWLDPAIVPSARFLDLLAEPSEAVRGIAIRCLFKRGQSAEAIAWLTSRAAVPGGEASRVWLDLATQLRLGPMDWEQELAARAMPEDPAGTLRVLSLRMPLTPDSQALLTPSPALQSALRTYLTRESRTPSVPSMAYPPAYQPGQPAYLSAATDLAHALRLLAKGENPEDMDLFRKFLDHPSTYLAYRDYTPGPPSWVGLTLTYPARIAALEILAAHGHRPDRGVVTETNAGEGKVADPAP